MRLNIPRRGSQGRWLIVLILVTTLPQCSLRQRAPAVPHKTRPSQQAQNHCSAAENAGAYFAQEPISTTVAIVGLLLLATFGYLLFVLFWPNWARQSSESIELGFNLPQATLEIAGQKLPINRITLLLDGQLRQLQHTQGLQIQMILQKDRIIYRDDDFGLQITALRRDDRCICQCKDDESYERVDCGPWTDLVTCGLCCLSTCTGVEIPAD